MKRNYAVSQAQNEASIEIWKLLNNINLRGEFLWASNSTLEITFYNKKDYESALEFLSFEVPTDAHTLFGVGRELMIVIMYDEFSV